MILEMFVVICLHAQSMTFLSMKPEKWDAFNWAKCETLAVW